MNIADEDVKRLREGMSHISKRQEELAAAMLACSELQLELGDMLSQYIAARSGGIEA